MKLIVGLGNPGKKYERTRHNAGFDAVDALAKASGLEGKEQAKHNAWIAKGAVGDVPVLLAKPTTYMNESGSAVQALLSYYKVAPEDLLIIQDDMDLLPSRMAFLAKGGAAGHNGIADIQERLGSDGIARLRIGIGRPTGQMAKEDWVLGTPDAEERTLIDGAVQNAAKAATEWITSGLNKAMNIWNTK